MGEVRAEGSSGSGRVGTVTERTGSRPGWCWDGTAGESLVLVRGQSACPKGFVPTPGLLRVQQGRVTGPTVRRRDMEELGCVSDLDWPLLGPRSFRGTFYPNSVATVWRLNDLLTQSTFLK